jgi:hypothetical protein
MLIERREVPLGAVHVVADASEALEAFHSARCACCHASRVAACAGVGYARNRCVTWLLQPSSAMASRL